MSLETIEKKLSRDVVIAFKNSREFIYYLHKKENISEYFIEMLNLAVKYNPRKHTKEKNSNLYDAYEWICDENDCAEILKTLQDEDKFYIYLLKS